MPENVHDRSRETPSAGSQEDRDLAAGPQLVDELPDDHEHRNPRPRQGAQDQDFRFGTARVPAVLPRVLPRVLYVLGDHGHEGAEQILVPADGVAAVSLALLALALLALALGHAP